MSNAECIELLTSWVFSEMNLMAFKILMDGEAIPFNTQPEKHDVVIISSVTRMMMLLLNVQVNFIICTIQPTRSVCY